MKKKAAIFSCNGLGDGIVSAYLCYNLSLNDYEVEIFHNSLGELGDLYPFMEIRKYPLKDQIPELLKKYDQIFISHNSSCDFVEELINLHGKLQNNKRNYM